jgi:hypothetical protein
VNLPMRRILFLCALAALLVPTVANAATSNQILRDCQDDGVLEGHYSAADLRKALRHIPSDVAEYTNCEDVLSRAADAAAASAHSGGRPGGHGAGGGGGTGGGGTPSGGGTASPQGPVSPSTPQDTRALQAAASSGPPRPVDVHGRRVASGFAADVGRNPLPSSLLTVLILIGAAVLTAAAPLVRRVLSRHRS